MTVRAGAASGFRKKAVAYVLILGASTLGGCAGSPPPKSKSAGKGSVPGFTGSANGVDDARCEVDGRGDRAKVISQALAAEHGSIQRVYATGANKEDGKRVVRCREVDTNLDGIKDLVRTYTDTGEPLMELADTDYDGEVDTWVTFARGVVAHIEVDRNADGKPDEYKFYSHGVLAKVQRDSDDDGKIDTWEIYDRGRLSRVGMDKNGDGNVDHWYRDPDLQRRTEEESARSDGKEPAAAEVTPASAEAESKGKPQVAP
jgi:hypothetical protein